MTSNKKKSLIRNISLLSLAVAMFAWPFTGNCKMLIPGPPKVKGENKGDVPVAAGPVDRISVMVHFQPTANRGRIRACTNARGGIIKHEYKTVLPRVMNLRNIPVQAISELEKIPGVERVEEDRYHPNLINLHRSTPLIIGLQSQINTAASM